MIDEEAKKQIAEIWQNHLEENQNGFDKEGILINNIDDSRLYAIEVVKIIMHNFQKGDFNIYDFKTSLDSYNKHNNLWGFTAKLGQMYFNQIIQANEQNIEKLTSILKDAIQEPKNLRDALSKIESLEKLTQAIYNKSKDKHVAPYPGAVGFFLSYFWQIHNHKKWPILYTSLTNAFNEIGLWKEFKTQKETYEYYYNLNEDIRAEISRINGKEINNWDVEHAFWNYKYKPKTVSVAAKAATQSTQYASTKVEVRDVEKVTKQVSFDIQEYLIPKLAALLDNNTVSDASGAPQTLQFEQLVAESFTQLDFELEILPVTRRKNAFAIIRFREENIAFIIDAMANSNEYFELNDDRIIKEYIKDISKDLKSEGFKKVGFILVSNSFEPGYNNFVNFITWNTGINKVTLLTSEALLYLLAYKNKHRYHLLEIVEKIVGLGHMVTATNIAEELGETAG